MNTYPNELSAWLKLSQAQALSNNLLLACLQQLGSPTEICNATKTTLKNIGLSEIQIERLKNPHLAIIRSTEQWLNESNNHHIIHFTDPRYPPLLKEISRPPVILYVHGSPKILSQPQIAIIGSRKPSFNGLEHAKMFAFSLAKMGLCITSGMALGIDGAAHQGALDASKATIAVLGTGLEHLYPKRHAQLAGRIADTGCVVSEFPLNTPPIPMNFPQRNRIISGLSLGTLVVEATPKSGSLITAKCALEQDREVFAIPGSPRNPAALGCLKLIQQGAKCVVTTEDILNEINHLYLTPDLKNPSKPTTKTHVTTNPSIDFLAKQVLACIDFDNATSIDQICERSKLRAQKVMESLLTLELADLIIPSNNGYIRL